MPRNSGKPSKRARKAVSTKPATSKAKKEFQKTIRSESAPNHPGASLASSAGPGSTLGHAIQASEPSTGPTNTGRFGLVAGTSDFSGVSQTNYAWNTHPGWSIYPPMRPPQLSELNAPPFPTHPILSSSPATMIIPHTISPIQGPGTQVPPEQQVMSPRATSPEGTRSRSRSGCPSSSDSGDERPPSSRRISAKRVRISRRNPSFGMVEGAMVGNKDFRIPRKRKLRDLQDNIASANKRFKREIEELISRAERLSIETDCWLILCAQLPGSTPTYHYTSARFRREALDDASAMVTAFQNATYALTLAKRKEAKEITDKYEKQLTDERRQKTAAESQAALAEEEVLKSRQREENLEAELERQKAMVETYRLQLSSQLASSSRGAGTIPN